MKSYLFIGSLLVFSYLPAQISVYSCDINSAYVTQNEIESEGYEYFKPCVLFGNNETYWFNGASDHKVVASNNIHIMPGFHAGPFDANGGMWLKINPLNNFDVALMNYTDLDNILKFEKLELGVKLNDELLTLVNNFVNDVPNSDKLNPYLDWEMRVYAEFTPEGAEWPFVIDGFYNQEFEVNMPDQLPDPAPLPSYGDDFYYSIGGWEYLPDDYPFRIRFAPPTNGNWTGKVKIDINQMNVYTSNPFEFNVIESGNVGYVKVGINKRYLRREGTFFPLGCNLNWPETTQANDPELYNYMSNSGSFASEGYRNRPCIPRVYDKYKDQMTLLAQGGANYFRWIMNPVSNDIEWEELGNYTDRLNMAQEMDEILEHAENLGLFIHWNMQIHYSLQESSKAYDRKWTWDFNTNNADYCYKTLIESNNPVDFLKNDDAKKYYKQRLRYILARWGYSTNVAVWELFSEISNVGAPDADNNDYYLELNHWEDYRDWQVEMANYLKSTYHGQCHLVTASYGGEKHPEDDTFESPSMDIMTSNIYDYNEPGFEKFWIDNVSLKLLNDNLQSSYSYNNIKPMIFSETDPIDALCDVEKVEWKRSLWQSVFSGLAGVLSWDVQLHPELFVNYGELKDFIDGIDFDGGAWHPGSSDQIMTPNGAKWIGK